MSDFLVTFFSTHHALKAEKILKVISPRIDLIPTPREINSECGFSVLIRDFEDKPSTLFKDLSYEHIYQIKYNSKGAKTYEKIY